MWLLKLYKLQQCASFLRACNRPPNFSIFCILLNGFQTVVHASSYNLTVKVKLQHNKEDGDGVQLKFITLTADKLELNALTQTEVRCGSCINFNFIIVQPEYGGLIDPPISAFSDNESKWQLLWQIFNVSVTNTAIRDPLMSFQREMNVSQIKRSDFGL